MDWFGPAKIRFGRQDPVRVFSRIEECARFEPEALAATREWLLNLDRSVFPTVSRALISLTRSEDRLLTAMERDLLWRRFHVPVFEQIIGMHGELLAAECEAHDGLHIQAEEWMPDNEAYCVDHSACACGSKQPRLSSPELIERVRAVAAYAR